MPRWVIAAVVALAVSWGPTVSAPRALADDSDQKTRSLPCKKMGRKDKVQLDFDSAELGAVAKVVSCLLEVNLMFQPGNLRSKTITVISSRPVDRDAVWSLFLNALHAHKLRVERRGGFYLITTV